MPKLVNKVPALRLHKASGQAIVSLSGRDHYCGAYGSKESRAEYERLLKLWKANGRKPLPRGAVDLEVNHLILAYWKYAQGYYVKDGKPTSQVSLIRQSLRFLKASHGRTLVSEFGPQALVAVRQRMLDHEVAFKCQVVDPDTGEATTAVRVRQHGLSRGVINSHIGRIRGMFRWGVEQEIVPDAIHSALTKVRDLAQGRTEAKDYPPVGPAPEASVEAILPVLFPAVRAMVQVQILAAMRPEEIVSMRACDLDRTGDVWFYTPQSHKTAHHGKARTICLGPQAQAILAPWIERHPDGYLFRPRGWNCVQKPRKTSRKVGECYSPTSYYRAVREACDKLEIERIRVNQFRHSGATKIRKEFGLDASRVILGHSDLKTAEIYAERDTGLAAEVARKMG